MPNLITPGPVSELRREFARCRKSRFGRLLRFSDETRIYLAHDYKGDKVSIIGEARAFNSATGEIGRRIPGVDEKPNSGQPEDDPADMRQGLHQDDVARRGWAFSATEALELVGRQDMVLIDLREKAEKERHGSIPASLLARL